MVQNITHTPYTFCVFNQTRAFSDLLTALLVVCQRGCWKHSRDLVQLLATQNLIVKTSQWTTARHHRARHEPRKLVTPRIRLDPACQNKDSCSNVRLNHHALTPTLASSRQFNSSSCLPTVQVPHTYTPTQGLLSFSNGTWKALHH